MQPNAPVKLSDPLITRRQLAVLLNVAPGTVANWECKGRGPRGTLIGRTKQYRLSVVTAWITAKEEADAEVVLTSDQRDMTQVHERRREEARNARAAKLEREREEVRSRA